jgi:predicted CXXCH cytochrome family protein
LPEFQKKVRHKPVAEGRCTDCHSPHASDEKGLLVDKERELCLGCHGPVQAKFTASKAFHPAKVNGGRCTICHAPHSADERWLAPKPSLPLCADCHKTHASLSHPMGGGVIDPRTKEPVVCLSCHDPHGTQHPNFLTFARERELCIQCHKTFR